jgi:hypothetical protein
MHLSKLLLQATLEPHSVRAGKSAESKISGA